MDLGDLPVIAFYESPLDTCDYCWQHPHVCQGCAYSPEADNERVFANAWISRYNTYEPTYGDGELPKIIAHYIMTCPVDDQTKLERTWGCAGNDFDPRCPKCIECVSKAHGSVVSTERLASMLPYYSLTKMWFNSKLGLEN